MTSRTLRLRRAHPEWFTAPGCGYWAVATSTGNAVAFARGGAGGPAAVAVATRLPLALERHGGWGEHTVALPHGAWRDLFTDREHGGGSRRLAALLTDLPVALLVRGG